MYCMYVLTSCWKQSVPKLFCSHHHLFISIHAFVLQLYVIFQYVGYVLPIMYEKVSLNNAKQPAKYYNLPFDEIAGKEKHLEKTNAKGIQQC